jgi:ribosomal-protein-alanine N-acetyltransferase
VSIRQAGVADLPGILAVEEAGIDSPWSSGQLESALQHPASLLLITRTAGLAVGYILFQTVVPETELLRLAVLPDYRRQGHAAKLLKCAFGKLAVQGVQSCFLEVRRSNTPARLLYAGQGFTKVGKRLNYYRDPSEDAVLMQYDLNGYRGKDEDNSGS